MSMKNTTPFYQPTFESFKKDDRFKQSFRDTLTRHHEFGDNRDFCIYGDACGITGSVDDRLQEKKDTCEYADRMGCPFNYTEDQLSARGVMTAFQEQVVTYQALHTIHGFPFFKAGTFNNITFTVSDLDGIVANFQKLGEKVKPVLKFGHGAQRFLKGEGLPALGWVEKVYRRGETLFADIASIPDRVYDLIRKKAYRRPSAEIYKNYKEGEKAYGPVLSAIALLGADAPAIKSLPDLEELFNREAYSDVVSCYNTNLNHETENYEFDETFPTRYGEHLATMLSARIAEISEDNESTGSEVISRMADAAGIEPGTVSQILRGDIRCPPRQRLEGFAKALDLSVDEIITVAKRDGCQYNEGDVTMSETTESTETSEQSKELEALKAQVIEHEAKIAEYEAQLADERERAAQAEKDKRLSELSETVSKWKVDGKILPKDEPKVFAILSSLSELSEDSITFKESGKEPRNVTPFALFQEVIESNPNLISFAEMSESDNGDNTGRKKAYSELLSDRDKVKGIDIEDIDLAEKAEALSKAQQISYSEALIQVSRELSID